jgi:hypothetical protein
VLKDDTAPPADSSVTTRFDPSYLVAIEKALVQENSSRVGYKRIFASPSAALFFHEHIIGDYCANSSFSQHSSALRSEGPDQAKIIFVARKKIGIIERSVEVRWRGNNQRDFAISDLCRGHLSEIAKENLDARGILGTLALLIHGLMLAFQN